MLERLYSNKEIILEKAQKHFFNSSLLTIKIGCELEFFLLQKNGQVIVDQNFLAAYIAELKTQLLQNFSLIYDLEKEQGVSQIEIKTAFTADLLRLCFELENAKDFIRKFSEEKNLTASFEAQPFVEDCGNALQFNISLHQDEKNLFTKKDQLFINSITALLQFSNEMLILLAPKPEDYLRFDQELNHNLHKKGKFTAPVNLSFGENNRTTAIRIPRLEKEKSERNFGTRIEYRLAAATADSYLVTAAILLIILRAIKDKAILDKSAFTAIYGNAFDQQYCLKSFAKNFVTAEKFFFKEDNFIKNSLELFLSL
jgi:glutamine synthetase